MQSLLSLFLFILPLTFFDKVAELTHKYCYEDWVVETVGTDRDGNPKKRTYLKPAPPLETGERRPKRHRHRGDKEKKKYKITTGFVLCWVAHLILQGALFGERKPPLKTLYKKGAYGVNSPLLRNVMTRDACAFMRRYIHFCDNDKMKKPGKEGYDPLFEIMYVLEQVGIGIRRAWLAG